MIENASNLTSDAACAIDARRKPLALGSLLPDAGASVLIFLVQIYRWTLSPAKTFLFGPLAQCRFEPSCSQYAMGALKTHGPIRGSWLAARRVCRCHPWGECGEDPVPTREFSVSHSALRTPHS